MSPEFQTLFFALAVACLLWAATPWPSVDGRVRWAAVGSASAWFVFAWQAFDVARAS